MSNGKEKMPSKNMNDVANLVDHWIKTPRSAFDLKVTYEGDQVLVRVGNFTQPGRGNTVQEAFENLFVCLTGATTLMAHVKQTKEDEIRGCQLELERRQELLREVESRMAHHREVLNGMNRGEVLPRIKM